MKTELADYEAICYELECAVNNLDAIHTAMTEGGDSADKFVDGLFFTLMRMEDLIKNFKTAIDNDFKAAKEQ